MVDSSISTFAVVTIDPVTSYFIAIPLAVYLRYHEKLADWVLQIAGIFQTIPSLALLGLFIPLMGVEPCLL